MASEARPNFEVALAAHDAVIEQSKRCAVQGIRRTPADITSCAAAAAERVTRKQVLDELTDLLTSDEVVEAATKRFTDIHWHNAPLKYGAHARQTMSEALQAAIASIKGEGR